MLLFFLFFFFLFLFKTNVSRLDLKEERLGSSLRGLGTEFQVIMAQLRQTRDQCANWSNATEYMPENSFSGRCQLIGVNKKMTVSLVHMHIQLKIGMTLTHS